MLRDSLPSTRLDYTSNLGINVLLTRFRLKIIVVEEE
jgi:hypothetical protein